MLHERPLEDETYIHKELYGLGSARNARTTGDPIPEYGRAAKRAIAGFLMQGNPFMQAEGMKKMELLNQEQWDPVESPVKRSEKLDRWCLDIARHDWFKNYWPNLFIPVGQDIPNEHAKLSPAVYKQFDAEPLREESGLKGSGLKLGN